MELSLAQAERFVNNAPRANWEGWDINIYQPEPNAYMRPNGAFHNGRWCLKFVIGPNSEGKYVVSKRNSTSASQSWH